MATVPRIQYAKAGDVHVAYQTFGGGSIDLVLLPDGFMTIEAIAELPAYARFRDQLASFSRLIVFDHRGLGLSDPVASEAHPSLEHWADDLRAVADAVGSRRPALLGIAEGGFGAAFYAASQPDRVSQLVLLNATPGLTAQPFAEWGAGAGLIERLERSLGSEWGEDTSGLAVFAPSGANDDSYHEWLSRSLRRSASPAVARAIFDLQMRSDIRDVLPIIQVPTLVIHRAGNRWFSPQHGQYLAEHVPDARYVEVAGDDHVPYFGDSEAIAAEIEEFLTGARGELVPDRVLATVLFTDIVGSTERAAELGDRKWRQLLDEHDALVREQLARFRGRLVNTIGDGFLATFDGPARAIQCSSTIRDRLRTIDLDVRSGLHAGECEMRGADLAGITVHIGQRIQALAAPGEVLVSQTVKDLVAGSGITFTDKGKHDLKGVPGSWRLFSVER